MKPERIREFLTSPRSLSPVSAERATTWLEGLDGVVTPGIAQASLHPLRDSQAAAIRGLAPTRCGLVMGPPGTGKTATLAWMALGYLLASRRRGQPCRILVTAFTRDAIANVLNALAERANALKKTVRIDYVGNPPDGELAAGVDARPRDELADVLTDAQVVVGMTIWSIHGTLEKGHYGGPSTLDAELFDLVCLDEASQMKVGHGLMALAPLKEDGRIVVVGDDRQLPPIGGVVTWAGDERGLGGSLYDFLKKSQVPEFELTETFRLNAPLAQPPAELFYENYVSADEVARRRLNLRANWEAQVPGWMRAALEPDYPVCILLHDGPPTTTRSMLEAELVGQLVEALGTRLLDGKGQEYRDALWQEGLAVVTPHRAQNALIRKYLRSGAFGADCTVETVDRIQGRERDAIIVSYSVADPEFAQVEAAFLFSPQRFNVAITRPRSKLILIVSRWLLEVLPSDEELVDAVAILREYVYGSRLEGSFQFPHRGESVSIDVRLRGFDDAQPLPEIEQHPAPFDPGPALTLELEEVDHAIRALAAQDTQWHCAIHSNIDKRLKRSVPFSDYRSLFLLGRILIYKRTNKDGGTFWALYPREDAVKPLPLREELVRENIRAVVEEHRRGFPEAFYMGASANAGVRDRFAWCDEDGRDQLLPLLRKLDAEGTTLILKEENNTVKVGLVSQDALRPPPPAPETKLEEDDFRLLNLLEDLEVDRINLGVVESWPTTSELLAACRDNPALRGPRGTLSALRGSLERLRQHGHVMLHEDRVRSRMAELARELRLAKQRFRVGDQDRRPFLVRAIKVLAEPREKPKRDRALAPVLARLAEQWSEDAHVTAVLQGIPETLRRGLKLEKGVEPSLSGFQERSLAALLPSWLGEEGPTAFVLTADTGAGKTEAGALPLLAGAAIDRLRGIEGTRAVLVYPRIRLAVNQAERLVGYGKALGEVLGSRLTVGLQSRDVPRDWQAASWADSDKFQERLWVREEGKSGWRFPFFSCPGCDAALRLEPGGADPDRLICDADGCGWSFDGWVGTKKGLRQAPPALLILVTESLHQWMQDPSASALFGDHHVTVGGGKTRTHAPPRALLADEIHLYAHVHGAQVGWMLQRFLARCRINGEPRPLAIGMSATLGEAARVWGDLCGRAAGEVHHIGPREGERGDNPRGREYFYFVQPEVESRGKDVAGAATTIQSLMLLAHGMRRRTGEEGGFRSLAFFDSIDKLKRLHTDFTDAEMRKNLAALRTRDYGADPQDPTHLRTLCCGEPRSCARFHVGECWYFAATDSRQVRAGGNRLEPGAALSVAPKPVSSATAGNVDKMLERSDLVFATSSLEVGYDDPDMMLVYQHYAPANLASFVQRKGRGGRGMDDRPVTGVTLSIHSPRDSWYFRHPARMLQAANFRVPVNMRNVFVRRGQVLSALLDIAARHSARTHWKPTPQLPPNVLSTADAFVREAFGEAVYQELEEESLQALWERVRKNATPPLAAGQSIRDWREAIVEVPSLLFDPINLPVLRVMRGEDNKGNELTQTEDVALALAECAPGRVTLRWGVGEAHWFPPRGARAPWFTSVESQFQTFSLDPNATEEEVARLVPEEVRKAVGGRFSPKILRPTRAKPQRAGTFQGATWTPTWAWDDANKKAIETGKGGVDIHHKTQGSLQGFVVAAQERSPEHLPFAVLRAFTDGQLQVYRSTPGEPRTGLRVTIAHWCSDVEVVLDTPKRDRAYHRQVFLSPEDGQTPQFVGYGFQPEGIRLAVDSRRLDAFLEQELLELEKDAPRSRWHHGQFLRYLVMTRSSQAGLNRFEARQLADLCITAAAVPDPRKELSMSVERRNPARLGDALKQAWQRHLTAHPQLTALRVERLMERLKTPKLDIALKSAFDDVKNTGPLRGYLRSALLQGLLIRLQHLFVIHGLTDENRVVGHARLPLQYDTHGDDLLTVCERGSGGDGTTRTFVESAGEVFQQWREERFLCCPNAEADRAVERAFQMKDRHGPWREKDPRDPEWVRQLASELGLEPEKDSTTLQGVLRLLYGGEELQGRRFELFELFGQVRTTRLELARELGREPTDWELVGTVVGKAGQGLPEVSRWRELLAAYQGVEEALSEGSLSPAARLAEQVYRLSARLCVDGCPACLHLGSDLMDDQLAEASTSRTLLERFGAFVFEQT